MFFCNKIFIWIFVKRLNNRYPFSDNFFDCFIVHVSSVLWSLSFWAERCVQVNQTAWVAKNAHGPNHSWWVFWRFAWLSRRCSLGHAATVRSLTLPVGCCPKFVDGNREDSQKNIFVIFFRKYDSPEETPRLRVQPITSWGVEVSDLIEVNDDFSKICRSLMLESPKRCRKKRTLRWRRKLTMA